MKRTTSLFVGLAVLGLLNGCASRPMNARLGQYNSGAGYYFHTHARTNNADDLLFILTFSGGGTRSASLACGVLEELAATVRTVGGKPRRLLDEVDAISSVSGGSVTAAAYALYGDAAFARLETNFLKRNVQGTLLWKTLNPLNWWKLWSPYYGRSDMAAEYYDRLLFQGAKFGDLNARPGPYLVINATDISSGARFDFTQHQFDLICSDLNPYPLSRAVAASSAVPALLSPITLNNYAGGCGYHGPEWIPAVLTNASSGRARFHAAEVQSYLDSTNRPYLHLVDGGVADNLGVRAVLDGMFVVESNPEYTRQYDLDRVRTVAIVCVNALSSPEKDWNRKESPPGVLDLAMASAIIPIDRYSYETVELLKDQIERLRLLVRERKAAQGASLEPDRELEFYPIVVSFADLEDAQERRYFLNQPTSFHLPAQAVDRLREAGGRLLRQSPVYQQLLQGLGARRGP